MTKPIIDLFAPELFTPLEDRLQAGDYPVCPIYDFMQQKLMRCERLIMYGLNSNYCPDCQQQDQACELYQDYLARLFLREKERTDVKH